MKLNIKIRRKKKNGMPHPNGSSGNGSKSGISDIRDVSLVAHERSMGKIEIMGKVPLKTLRDLAIYYTPGVSYPSLEIKEDKDLSYVYTARANRIAILTDGSRVLGLGNIGPEASLPVMEGKSLLFKKFGNIDALPLAIRADTADEIVAVAKAMEPGIGGINLEDISSPKCFEVFDRLQKEMNIPVFHDDREGTAVVTLAALQNALKLVGKELHSASIVINGSGAAGVGIAQLLLAAGAANIIMCDKRGILYKGRADNMNNIKELLAEHTNRNFLKGQLVDAVKNSDVLIGASTAGAFNEWIIKSMAPRSIVFALANPDPEITYNDAKAAGAEIVATGASNVPNQINNVLAFPAIFRGALDVQARKINTQMLLAAANALSASVKKAKLNDRHIVPNFSEDDINSITANIAAEVAKAAMDTGVSRIKVDPAEISSRTRAALVRYSKLEKAFSNASAGRSFASKFFKR